MLAHFVTVLVQCWPAHSAGSPPPKRYPAVAMQLLQTLSILVQNTERETSIYFLFSNNYINDLIGVTAFDFDADEEVLAWYISFLKAISIRLNSHTIQFFVGDARASPSTPSAALSAAPDTFPLYSRLTRYVRHSETLVCTSARIALLNIFRVDDPAARAFALAPANRAAFFVTIAQAVKEAAAELRRLMDARARWGAQSGAADELEDLLCYCADLLGLEVPSVVAAAAEALWEEAVSPLLLVLEGSSGRAPLLFSLSRLCRAFAHTPLLPRLHEALLAPGAPGRACMLRSLSSPLADFPAAAAALYLLLSLSLAPAAAAAAAAGREAEEGRAAVVDALCTFLLYCAQLSDSSGCDGAAASSAVLQALAHSAWLMRRLLRGGAAASASAENSGWAAGLSAAQAAALSAVAAASDAQLEGHLDGPWADALLPLLYDSWRLAGRSLEAPSLGEQQVAAHLWRCAQAAPGRQAASPAPPGEVGSAAEAQRALRSVRAWAVLRAARSLLGASGRALRLPEALSQAEEEAAAAGAGSTPASPREPPPAAAGDDSDDSFDDAEEELPSAPPSPPRSEDGRGARGPAAGAGASAPSLSLAAAVAGLRAGDAPGGAPPAALTPPPRLGALDLGALCGGEVDGAQPASGAPSEDGSTATSPGRSLAPLFCRVAFEAGRERRLSLRCQTCTVPLLAPGAALSGCSLTAMLLLIELERGGGGAGSPAAALVRSVAPVVGACVRIDEAHPTWLHVRVRPSLGALRQCAAPGGGGAAGGAPPASPVAGAEAGPPPAVGWPEAPRLADARRMMDGHWTLAFDSPANCEDALGRVRTAAERVRRGNQLALRKLQAALDEEQRAGAD